MQRIPHQQYEVLFKKFKIESFFIKLLRIAINLFCLQKVTNYT